MSFSRISDIAASGLAAQRLRVQLIAGNIANSETTRTPEGGPFRRKDAVFRIMEMGAGQDGRPFTGVQVASIEASREPFITKFEPNHPDADAQGLVAFPNVNPMEEMVNLITAKHGVAAGVAVARTADEMLGTLLDLKK